MFMIPSFQSDVKSSTPKKKQQQQPECKHIVQFQYCFLLASFDSLLSLVPAVVIVENLIISLSSILMIVCVCVFCFYFLTHRFSLLFFLILFSTHRKFSYRMVHVIAMEVLPEERDRKYYADSYSCCPPPLFILLITIIEVRF